ncbi:serine hydrolase [Amycolatopsis antarctica]|uniref:Serine hydrolase n=1 Tax=Amycolatopsis antarctica TaxID=1854586 RepID=A0A263D3K6_9PSEU|nr:serine hydrolase domain-containing protein [Amycolatopsis antarctica]OZM72036.1 serine hydrolase [Amycolatopsis antarctica]
MSDIQKKVQGALDDLVESGAEVGVQAAVYHRGELVVDAVSGVADSASGRAFTSDTPVYSTSTGKGATSAVLHTLVEKGVLDYETPIATLWPEFGVQGKDKATVRHALTHTTGVPGVPAETTPEDLCDWDKMCRAIAGAAPWWEPGTKTGYHAQTYGYIIGEIVRRATGKPISQVLREEIAVPLGIADELFFGVPAAELGRLATLEEAPADPAQQQEGGEGEGGDFDMSEIPFFRVVDGFTAAPMAAMPDATFGNRSDVLNADIPAGGTFSARAIARVYAALLGDVGGVRLVSADRLAEIAKVAISDQDEIIGFPSTRGLGYDIGFQMGPLDSPNLIGMAGSFGTAAYADTEKELVVAVNKNRVHYGQFDAFNRVSDVVLKSLGDK